MPKMDRKSWPWKKKSSDKSSAEKATATLGPADASLPSGGSQSDKDKYKKPNYVQISVESYAHLTGLEDQIKTYVEQLKISNEQVKTYEEQLKTNKEQLRTYEEQLKTYEDQLKTLDEQIDELNEKLSDAHTEMINKEGLVKQHAKVAEEAVSGWEKAESEAASLKTHLEAVTLSKMTAEDRAAHLDGALKECMRQIRNLKEEHEQKVQDVVRRKDAQYDEMRREFEARIAEMDHEILRSEAESDALSRSLQERSTMLIKMTEEKSQAEAEIEHLKNSIEACERERNTLKYELHIVSKELDIRNEEKNMSMKSAEVANKQHMEGVKKIAKLEAECQRLRGLVRKKLPGPAALAQMKVEVESLGRDYGETRRRSPVRPGSPLLSPHRLISPVSDFSLDGAQKFQKENEYLTERLLAMEEETKMLKEALSRRNGELQASRGMYAKTASKLQSIEVQFHKQKDYVTSVSEDGNDDTVSVAESWASAMVPRSRRTDSASQLELMDDFLEMERLAHLSNGDAIPSLVMKLQLRISKVFESMSNSSDLTKVIEEIERAVKEVRDSQNPESCVLVEKHCSEDAVITSESGKIISRELETAISEIHAFVLSIGKEAAAFQRTSDDEDGLSHRVDLFAGSLGKVLCNEMSLADFVVSLSSVMVKVSDLSFNFTGYKSSSPDCIDKVALSDSSSNPEFPSVAPFKCSLEEYERMKAEKDDIERELETAKSQLKVAEQALVEVRLQLESSHRSNSLAETQLKCMAESYNALEKKSEELQAEANLLRSKAESLEIELESEKADHQDALAKCKDLEEQAKRKEECSLCSSMAADPEDKSKQEKELADAAEKLAECQDTIFLLAKQLKAMHSQTDAPSSPPPDRVAEGEALEDEKPETSGTIDQDQAETDIYNTHFCPSDSEVTGIRRPATGPKSPRHRHTKSGSSSTASTPTPEKQSRGLSRFFSSKGSGRH